MIEPVSVRNLDAVLPLIAQYQAFYRVEEISTEKNRAFFAQFGEQSQLGCQFLFRNGEQAVGFATVYVSFASTIAEKVAVLNDLYVCPQARGQGVARKLIAHCQTYAQQQGAVRLQWVTALDNAPAQKLYDGLAASKSTWHFYTLGVGDNAV